jgi:DUF971 family protein
MSSDPSGAQVPLSVDVEERELVIGWGGDHVTRLTLEELRRRCTCAACAEQRSAGGPVWPQPGSPQDLLVEGAELVGAWGISLRFNDRHEQGVYTWETLRSWCRCPRCRPRRGGV